VARQVLAEDRTLDWAICIAKWCEAELLLKVLGGLHPAQRFGLPLRPVPGRCNHVVHVGVLRDVGHARLGTHGRQSLVKAERGDPRIDHLLIGGLHGLLVVEAPVNKVVARYAGGRLARAQPSLFFPNKDTLHVSVEDQVGGQRYWRFTRRT
jgi:hypothetical protein